MIHPLDRQSTFRGPALALAFAAITCIGCKSEVDLGKPPNPDYDPLRDGNITPLVLATSPASASRGPYEQFGTAVQVRFNKIMTLASMRQAVRYSAPDGDISAVVLDTADGATFLVEALRKTSPARFWWKVGEQYSLTVDTTAEDINKNRLSAPFEMSFLPEPDFRLLDFSPEEGATDVPPDLASGSLRLAFNSELDSSLLGSVHITPEVEGEWRLEDTTRLFFHPGEELALGAFYTMTVDPGAHDAYGHQIVLPASSSFTTQEFRLERTYPFDGMARLPQTITFAVRCNAAIDTASVRSAFSTNPFLNGYFILQEREFYFVPSPPLHLYNTYSATVRQTLRSADGHHLPSNYTFSFQTDYFRVISFTPVHNSKEISTTTHIQVTCNDRVLLSSVRAAFDIYPYVPGTFDSCCNGDCGGYTFCFIPSVPLAPNSLYYVNIGGRVGNDYLPYILSVSGDRTSVNWYFFTGD